MLSDEGAMACKVWGSISHYLPAPASEFYIGESKVDNDQTKCEYHPSDASDEAWRAPSYDDQHDTQNPSGDIEAALTIFISRIFYI